MDLNYHYRGIRGATRLRRVDLAARYYALDAWLQDFFRTHKYDERVLILEEEEEGVRVVANAAGKQEPRRTYVKLTLLIFTATHEYRISVRPPQADGQDTGYVGCMVKTRMARAGEDWQRGNDLHDGPYTQRDFNLIVADIARYETVALDIQEVRYGIGPDGDAVGLHGSGALRVSSIPVNEPVWLLERVSASGIAEWLRGSPGSGGGHEPTRDANLAIRFRSEELARAWKHVIAGGSLSDKRHNRDFFPDWKPVQHQWLGTEDHAEAETSGAEVARQAHEVH